MGECRRSANRFAAVGRLALSILAAAAAAPLAAQPPAPSPGVANVRVVTDSQGSRLQVDGRDFFAAHHLLNSVKLLLRLLQLLLRRHRLRFTVREFTF